MPSLSNGHYNAVLFDVDGTLVDTAPDMVAVLQVLQDRHGVAAVDYELGRAQVSNGALGLLRLGFPAADEDDIERLRLEFLDLYATRICERSRLFDGLDGLLAELEQGDVTWGVVTNKPHALTVPLLAGLDLAERAACIVSGDTLPQRKPDPAPLLHACSLAGVAAARTIYVGDASRDIEAGHAAGMGTIAVAYGYITPGDDASAWGAHDVARDTEDLAQILAKAVNLGA